VALLFPLAGMVLPAGQLLLCVPKSSAGHTDPGGGDFPRGISNRRIRQSPSRLSAAYGGSMSRPGLGEPPSGRSGARGIPRTFCLLRRSRPILQAMMVEAPQPLISGRTASRTFHMAPVRFARRTTAQKRSGGHASQGCRRDGRPPPSSIPSRRHPPSQDPTRVFFFCKATSKTRDKRLEFASWLIFSPTEPPKSSLPLPDRRSRP